MFDPQKILQQILDGGEDSGDRRDRKPGISADTLANRLKLDEDLRAIIETEFKVAVMPA